MTMLKIWEDRYINTRLIDQACITSEKGCCGKLFYNVNLTLSCQEGDLWMGQFDSLEYAQEAIEEIFNDDEVIEFVPDYN
jgi:hypothetical protein